MFGGGGGFTSKGAFVRRGLCPEELLFRVAYVQRSFCSEWLMSRGAFVQSGLCPEELLFRVAYVQRSFCSEWLMSRGAFVQSGLCPEELLFSRAFVLEGLFICIPFPVTVLCKST